MNTVSVLARTALPLILVAVVACGGSGSTPGDEPAQPLDVDSETAQMWGGWATEAQLIVETVAEMYRTSSLLPSRAQEFLERASALADEIRATDPSNDLVLSIVDDLDEMVLALEYGVEYARNAGHSVVAVEIPSLIDAISRLSGDADALKEAVESS